MTDKKIVFVTVPDSATAEKIAEVIVDEHLAACANIIPGLLSIYVWKGKVEKSKELLMVIKTREDRFQALHDRILELHPYEVPEIVSVPIECGFHQYLGWIDDCLGPKVPS